MAVLLCGVRIFPLSYKGCSVIVDPGTYTYNKNRKTRDKFRSYAYDNVILVCEDDKIDLSENGVWGLREYFKCYVDNFTQNSLHLYVKSLRNRNKMKERDIKIKNEFFYLEDCVEGNFSSVLHLSPDIIINFKDEKEIKTNLCIFKCLEGNMLKIDSYDYSPNYGSIKKAKSIILSSKNMMKL